MVDYQILFHPIAKDDLKEIYEYYSRISLQYANSFLDDILDRIEDLKQFPKIGKIYNENTKYRQLIYQNYRVLYLLEEQEHKITIMMVIHCARRIRI